MGGDERRPLDRRAVLKKWKVGLLTFLATALAVLLLANLELGEKRVTRNIAHLYATQDAQFLRGMNVLLGPQLLGGNRVQALVNGDRIFPEMLNAIKGAMRTITFETYIYWKGEVGEEFTRALSERAQAGVKVLLIYDAIGSQKIDPDMITRMQQAGVDVRVYNPVRWNSLARMNNRTHRKILVVDGRTGFTGGVGIADEWAGDAHDPAHWRDTHFRVEGPAVAQMQAGFMENWIEITGEVPHGADYFGELAPAGAQLAQFFISSPGGGGESMQLMYLLSIAAAREAILLSAAYFVPDDNEVRMLVEARNRGVAVRIIVPGTVTDSPAVRRASRSTWGGAAARRRGDL
jgi:cardiolipin synthase